MARFKIEVFEQMLFGDRPAVLEAEKYLKKCRKYSSNGKPTIFAEQLAKVRETNKRKSARRYSLRFKGRPKIPSGTLCQHCGDIACEQDHIIPHTKQNVSGLHLAIVQICRKLKVKDVPTNGDFIRSPLYNRLFLCSNCNASKAEREMAIRWSNVPTIVKFYFAELRRKPRKKEATINNRFLKPIGRCQRNIRKQRALAAEKGIDLYKARQLIRTGNAKVLQKKWPDAQKIVAEIDRQFKNLSRLEKERDKLKAA